MEKGQNAPMRDLIRLESTLYSLTQKCTKTCKAFMKKQFDLGVENGALYERLGKDSEMDNHYKLCLEKCTFDYASLHQLVRKKFMGDMDNIYDHNQRVYDDFYRSDS